MRNQIILFILVASLVTVISEFRDCSGVRNESPVIEQKPVLTGEV